MAISICSYKLYKWICSLEQAARKNVLFAQKDLKMHKPSVGGINKPKLPSRAITREKNVEGKMALGEILIIIAPAIR